MGGAVGNPAERDLGKVRLAVSWSLFVACVRAGIFLASVSRGLLEQMSCVATVVDYSRPPPRGHPACIDGFTPHPKVSTLYPYRLTLLSAWHFSCSRSKLFLTDADAVPGWLGAVLATYAGYRHDENERSLKSNLSLCNETLHMVAYLTSDPDIQKVHARSRTCARVSMRHGDVSPAADSS